MRTSVADIRGMKERKERIPVLTAYDVVTARIADAAGIPILLVGDSLGMAVLGYDTTIPVRLDDVIYHTRAVVRGSEKALVVADMPFMTYHRSVESALENAGRCVQEGGAQAVKLEGGTIVAETIRRLVACGVPVMGHIGLLPQSVNQLGGFKVQGKTLDQAKRLLADAAAVEEAGAFSIVLECIPAGLSALITERLAIPTIGIGAGPSCDGQVQVVSDILGWTPEFKPRHAKVYTTLAEVTRDAIGRYADEVKSGAFPTSEHGYTIEKSVLEELRKGG